ncbi:hypothetical protein SCHPADRAFT_820882 [Schizopora paradoxa]|uniref:Cysteine-rich protein 1 n=1 Tax=Schizopora paradoxa TaxID=27342 RepID=A0A0H2S089_9AGAM|nr:hypothetical protein SCHPADRAFT_820882 [Schizopora paradoxa]
MHPFGGIPICPRCEKAVYAAEQTMGPDRTLYHKLCLTCTSCNKRLDSRSLVEHNKEPYCTHCHRKNFAPKDLRQANLPDRDEVPQLFMPSPVKGDSPPKQSPISPSWTHRNQSSPPPIFKRVSESVKEIQDKSFTSSSPDRSLADDSNRWSSPVASSSRPPQPSDKVDDKSMEPSEDAEEPEDEKKCGEISNVEVPRERIFASPLRSTPTSFATNRAMSPNFTGPPSPLRPTMTGTRYGAALTPLSPLATGGGWSPRASPLIGGGTPRCAHCEKPVYFAEQVKAVGKIFHKPCLRCTDCNASLDSNRLAEKDGRVVCRSCYSKHYGPRGSGYALVGKAGG